MRFTRKESLLTVIIFISCMWTWISFAQDWWDCGLSFWPEEFKDAVNETFTSLKMPQLFFTDNQLEAVQMSLDTYCCRTDKISKALCEKKTLYPDGKNVIHSPFYLDHFLSIYRLYLRGDDVVCNTYDFDCFARIDDEKGYPWKSLCFRFGEDGDARCKSLYDVWSGVDILWASTDISSPSNYRALYEKFWVNADNALIPSAQEAKNMDPNDLTILHMWHYMCNEVNMIYNQVLRTNTSNDKSMNPIPWSTLQKCRTSAMQYYKSNWFDYVNALSLAKWVDQMRQINEQSRNHVLDVMWDVKKTMVWIRTKMTNMLKKFPSFTNTCSA